MISQTTPACVSERWYNIPRLLKSLPSDDGYSHSASRDDKSCALLPICDENGWEWLRHECRRSVLRPRCRRQNDDRLDVDDEMGLHLEPYQDGRNLNISVSNQTHSVGHSLHSSQESTRGAKGTISRPFPFGIIIRDQNSKHEFQRVTARFLEPWDPPEDKGHKGLLTMEIEVSRNS